MKISFLAFGLLATHMATSSFSRAQAQQAPTANTNLARGKKFVSSDPNTKKWGTGLTDGSWVPARGSTFATGDTDTFPKSVTVDLEEAKTLGYVAVGAPAFGSTKTVSVSLSADGTNFTEVGRTAFAEAQEQKHIFKFAPVSARYVKLTYLDHHAKRHGYIPTYGFTTELAVYAPGAEPVLPPTPTILEPADAPAPKLSDDNVSLNARFKEMHESFLARGKEGPIGVLFIGDSITDYWRRDNAKDIWARFARYSPANFGIGGDKTQHVLWRIQNGELDGIKPKVVVLMIGTNNTRAYSNEAIVKADQKIVAEIHRRLPDSKVLLLGIFPRAVKPNDAFRTQIKSINAELAKLDDGNTTRYLDIGDKFLEADGTLSKEVMPDALHPSPKGYQIWADAMSPLLDEMMK
jgi:beta-glucosidase